MDEPCEPFLEGGTFHDPHSIMATNQLVGNIGYVRGSVIGQELAR